jgi:chorismate mutase
MTSQGVALDDLRAKIDTIDQTILGLLAERIQVVIDVGEYKRERGLPVYDPERERSILERIARLAPIPLDEETARNIFDRIIDECRRVEQRHVGQPARSAAAAQEQVGQPARSAAAAQEQVGRSAGAAQEQLRRR